MCFVVQNWRQPAFAFCDGPALAPRVVLDLIALDFADAEIGALWMAEIKAAHGRAGPHRKAFGQFDADALTLEQAE